MKVFRWFVWAAVALSSGSGVIAQQDIGTAFTYQGTLENGSGSVTDTCDFRFGLWDADAAGTQVGASPITVAAVDVVAGTFSAAIDFGAGAIDGTARWLEIEVQCPGDAGFVLLTPRVALSAAPYALALPGLYTQETMNSPNIIGGHITNIIQNGVTGATIGGGGDAFNSHTISDHYGTIAGGRDNQAGDDDADSLSAMHAAVCGGISNNAAGTSSFVGGGDGNVASGGRSIVGGGVSNTASRSYSTVPGGSNNWAGGDYSFAAGKRAIVRDPAASGDIDGDEGTFVWADSTTFFPVNFVSTGPNQFLILATGGVGIGTNAPTDPLTVAGVVRSTTGGFELPDGTVIDTASDLGLGDITGVTAGTGLTGGGSSGSVTLNVAYAGTGAANSSARSDHYHSTLAASDGFPLDAVVVDASGNVGIGTTPQPSTTLTVTGQVIMFDTTILGGTVWVDADTDRVGIGAPNPSATVDIVGSLEVDTNTLYVNNSTDRVGIGTTNPSEKLTVAGVVYSTSGGIKFPDNTTQTTACPVIISASVAVNPPSISAGSNTTLNVTVTGAAVGDAVIANPGGNLTASYAIQYVRVSAADTVTIGLFNPGSVTVDPGSTTWEFRIIK